jgi:uncharacterized membrane protein
MPKKSVRKKTSKKIDLNTLDKKLDKLIQMEAKDLKGDEEIKELEKEEIKEQEEVEDLEEKQLKELEKLEKDLKEEIKGHPLRNITQKDIGKGLIGAFAAVVSHFVFLEGAHVGEKLSNWWTLGLYVVALLLGAIMLYVAGFRSIKDKNIIYFMPIRLFVIYCVSLITIVLVLVLYQQFENFHLLYKQVGALAIPAMLGASIADLLGKSE